MYIVEAVASDMPKMAIVQSGNHAEQQKYSSYVHYSKDTAGSRQQALVKSMGPRENSSTAETS